MDNEAEEQPPKKKYVEQNLTVQLWWDDGDIHYSRPTIETLKPDESLFDILNRMLRSENWGLVSYDSTPAGIGKSWYRRLPTEQPTV